MTTVQTTNSNAILQNLMNTMNPSSSTSAASSASSSSGSSVSSIQNNFMTLLVAQMQNQDPLNPMDNSQVTSQLAQLSTVSGVNQLNTTLTNLQSSYQASQSLQAAGMIGHTVMVPGSDIALGSAGGAFGIELPSGADSVSISITDSSGNVVRKMSLGTTPSGDTPLVWDGKTDSGSAAPTGTYTFQVNAVAGGAQIAGAKGLMLGDVNSVSTSSQGVKLNVTGAGAVDVSDVRQIL